MSLARDPSLRHLSACACCAGRTPRTPMEVANRPGLSAIAYRVGSHGDFKESLIAGLSDYRRLALQRLNTRDDDDFSIALLDAWSVVADVLTFYQERIANEAYLRTATEPFSVVELARAVGYEPSPGVAASTYLAFTLEDTPGFAKIDERTKVQSLPGPGEKPQTFETVEQLEAKSAWNIVAHRRLVEQDVNVTATQIVLEGIDLNLRAGDAILIGKGGKMALHRIEKARANEPQGKTTVDLGASDAGGKAVADGVWVMRVCTGPFGHNAPKKPDYNARGAFLRKFSEWDLAVEEGGQPAEGDRVPQDKLYLDATYDEIKNLSPVVVDRPAVNRDGEFERLFLTITDVAAVARADYGLSARVTRLTLSGVWWEAMVSDIAHLRQTTVYAQAQELTPAQVPDTKPVYDDEIDLAADGGVRGLPQGREVLFAGPRARVLVDDGLQELLSAKGAQTSPGVGTTLFVISTTPDPDDASKRIWRLQDEHGSTRKARCSERQLTFVAAAEDDPVVGEAVVVEVDGAAGDLQESLRLAQPLENAYDRARLTIYGNVALATHGETQKELLGSGDATASGQEFSLRQSPPTYVPAPTPSGGASTLSVRVDGVRWEEVDSFFAQGPRDRVYTTRRDEEGKLRVRFGDGRAGARLPTGLENVSATYRQGVGLEGQVRARQLSLLMTRPLGVKDVVNPIAATGAEDPEATKDSRRNAPLTVLTLDRVVSLKDYADFARGFGGIAKALATWTWNGDARGVFLTVASERGDDVIESGTLHSLRLEALRRAGDARVPLTISLCRKVPFKVAARVRIASPKYEPETVIGAVRAALSAHFAFEARSFGQTVSRSEVVSVMQGIEGVVAVDLNSLYRGNTADLALELVPFSPEAGGRVEDARPAELLTLDPASLAEVEVEA